MVKRFIVDENIKRKIQDFAELLKLHDIAVEKVILYGSFAKGHATENSDIDLCVVSSKFDKDPDYYFQKIWHLAAEIDSSLEPIPFTPKELANKYSTLSHEIKRYGIRIV